jgi:predicted dehydrogenase
VLGRAGGVAACERIGIGIIGSGIMGSRHRNNFHSMAQSEVVAVCDVDPARRAQSREHTRPGTFVCSDYRELLDRADVDAVAISTPHHSHAWLTVAAIKAGKDVYCEKPLTRTIHESRVVLDAVRRYGRILEVGTHRRAGVAQRLTGELVRNRRIGDLKRIHIQNRPGTGTTYSPAMPAQPVPEGLDWDLWLGPAPWTDFCPVPWRRLWNRYLDYSIGEITLTDCHIIDGALWSAEPFLKGPVKIEGQWKPEPHCEYRVSFDYASGVTVLCEARDDWHPASPGARFEGTKGVVHNDLLRYTMRTEPVSLRNTTIRPDEVHLKSVRRLHNEWMGVSEDFLHCVRTREEPLCPVEGGHAMTVMSQLIWIASRLQRPLTWDDVSERFVDDDDANTMLHYAYRYPCTL